MTLSNEMRRLGQYFLEAYDDRRVAVIGIRASTAQELAEFHAVHQAMAAEQQQRLSEQAGALRRDTAAFLGESATAHQAMAAEQQQRLSEQADALRRDTAALLEELDAAHQAMAEEQRGRLATERARLASDVAAMRGELQADLSEAQRLWGGFNLLMRQRRAKKPVAPPPPPPPVEKVAPPPVVEVAPDDLTAIRGIGPRTQQLLNEVGIYTFALLAESTPEDLRKVLGGAARLGKVEEWIEQARELART